MEWRNGVAGYLPGDGILYPANLTPGNQQKIQGGRGVQKTFEVFTLKIFLRKEEVGISGGSIRNFKIIVLL